MKHILCFGDSNTWGYVPLGCGKRYPEGVRWTSVLQNRLGSDFLVYEEGLCGRTTIYNDPDEDYRIGSDALPMTLDICDPLDLVIFKLGSNDVKILFGQTVEQITRGLEILVKQVLAFAEKKAYAPGALKILIVAPAPLRETVFGSDMEFFANGIRMYNAECIEKSRNLAPCYEALAEKYGCAFLDAGKIITSSDGDGLHLSPEAHIALGEALAEKVRSIL